MFCLRQSDWRAVLVNGTPRSTNYRSQDATKVIGALIVLLTKEALLRRKALVGRF